MSKAKTNATTTTMPVAIPASPYDHPADCDCTTCFLKARKAQAQAALAAMGGIEKLLANPAAIATAFAMKAQAKAPKRPKKTICPVCEKPHELVTCAVCGEPECGPKHVHLKQKASEPMRTEEKMLGPDGKPVSKVRRKRIKHKCDLCHSAKRQKQIQAYSRKQFGVDYAHPVCLRKRDRALKKAGQEFQPEVEASIKFDPDSCLVDPAAFAIYRDINGTIYLRITNASNAADFVVLKHWQIERVTLDRESAESLNLTLVEGSSIEASARLMLRPLNESTTISLRAKCTLENVLGTKEIDIMASEQAMAEVKAPKSKKVAKKAAKPATAKKAASKKAAAATERAPRISVVTFKKAAKEGTIPAQAMTILEVIKSKGTITTDKLFPLLESKLETKQPVNRIYAFYRKTLLDGGHIKVAKAE